MSSPFERARAYLELPSEQLAASTPGEFSRLLGQIMTAKGLTASQVAIRAKIPRSQAYNIVSASRTTLPSKPEQVRAFVEACDLAPVQVAVVMDLWTKLDQQNQLRGQGDRGPPPTTGHGRGSLTPTRTPGCHADRAPPASARHTGGQCLWTCCS
jgi:hypothetical protein